MFGFRMPNKMDEVVKVLHEEMAKETEACIVQQLGELIKRGLLVVEDHEPVLVEYPTGEYKIMKKVFLKSREHEYIAKLEKEISELRGSREGTRTDG